MKSYLSVSSIFCTLSMYYFYNQREKWSIVRLQEGLCRLKWREDILREGTWYLTWVQLFGPRAHASWLEKQFAGVFLASPLGVLGEGIFCSADSRRVRGMLNAGPPGGRGASGVCGVGRGLPSPPHVPSLGCGLVLGSGELASSPRGQEAS